MMFVPVALLAILPTYHTAGISAVIMLVLVRMLQGFALGGEVGNVLFLIECSPPKYRGFFGSFEVLSAIIGAAMSSVVVLICNALISQEEFLIWGWRIPFIAGTAIGIIGSIFRACSGETPVFENSKKTVSLPLATLFRKYKKALFVAIGIDSLEETSLYLFLVFLNVYFTTKMGFSDITFELIHLLFLGLLGIFTLLAALFSDFFGRKLMLLIAAVSSIIFAYPIFLLMESGLFPCIIIAKTLFVLIVGLSLGPVSTAVYEILPVEVSYTGLALSRNISSALFGGMAPAFAVLLISASGTSSAGAIPLIIVGLVTLFSLCFYKPVEKFEQF
ncbi:sugar (and other) transporter family protein [Neorickettsia helminthoeca str. Oregon]|uniref:Sugar (And other) transporter family protein n=2 Tax=Neorickettsia helminthoeca TaxID=33994 RepID=X5H519_9RICK|nr:sugar (and other) transporter family protein [Neorickettsia helminthoeca str. Oregon]